MCKPSRFAEMMQRVLTGDQDAATQLFEEYAPEIRRYARVQLRDSPLQSVLDSADVCQSVMRRLFVVLAGGQIHLESPPEMIRFLIRIARNRIVDQYRHETAQCRGGEQHHADASLLTCVPASVATPCRELAGKELLEKVYHLLTGEERYLVDGRQEGRGWKDLGAEIGETADGVRKRVSRALERVACQLDL
jgi:RNA polymerase sigma factor (sigma-70 family)